VSILRRPDRRIPRRAGRRPGEVAALVAVILSVTAPVILSLWQRGELLRYGYEIEKLKSERGRLAELKRKLLVERSSLQSLATVESSARRDLGLVEPPNERLFVVQPAGGTP